VTLLAYEATRNVRVVSRTVQTPLQAAVGVKLSPPRPLVVPILRAGLGMLEGMTRLIPTAEVGFLGMARNEETLVATTYAERLPSDVTDVSVHPGPHARDGRHPASAWNFSSGAAPTTSPASA
jgi:uracil phosphoribosyltransferase